MAQTKPRSKVRFHLEERHTSSSAEDTITCEPKVTLADKIEDEKRMKTFTQMDSENRRRVGDHSTPIKQKSNKRKTPSASPAPSRRSKAKKTPKTTREEEETSNRFYLLKVPGILEEKTERGQVYYLVNWADDPVSGQTYPPSWEKYSNVTKDVVAAWQRRKSISEDQASAPEQEKESTQALGTIVSTPGSEPPRAAKRRRITHGPNPTAEETTPPKNPRGVGTVDSARFQSVGQATLPKEIKDSYEDEELLIEPLAGRVRVEVPIRDSLDPEEYSRVVTSSQSQITQPLNSSQSRGLASSQLQTPEPRHRFSSVIWDEDIEGVIPDSQDKQGSASYEPSTTPISKVASSSRPNTGSHSAAGLEQDLLGATQLTSSPNPGVPGSIDSQLAEPLPGFTQASYRESGLQSSSVQTEFGSSAASDKQQSLAESQEGQVPSVGHFSNLSIETVPSPSPEPSALPGRDDSSRLITQKPSDSSLWLRTIVDAENQSSSHPQSRQPAESELGPSSSIYFGTQVPIQRYEYDEDNGNLISPDVQVESPRNDRHEEQTTSLEIPETQTLQESEIPVPVSSFEATWTAARFVSATPQIAAPATPGQTPVPEEILAQKTPNANTKPDLTGTDIDGSLSSSRDFLAAKSSDRSQESSGSLPSPPFESASAEQFAQVTSQFFASSPLQSQEGNAIESDPSKQPTSPTQPSVQSILQSIEIIGRSSRENSATSIPAVRAAQSIRSRGRDASLRGTIDLTMDTPSPAPVNPIYEKLQQRKAEAIARNAAARAAAAAAAAEAANVQQLAPFLEASIQPLAPPPTVPTMGEQAVATNEQAVAANQILPVQVMAEPVTIPTLESILAPEPEELEADDEDYAETTPTGLRMLAQGPEEYAVPLPMVSHARDVYDQTMRAHKSARAEFLTQEVFDVALVNEIDSMLADLDSLCNHQDLIVDDFSTQKLETVAEQAKWAENVSTKCIFLAEFLTSLRAGPKQVAILVRPGRMLEILEALFQWHGFLYNRADRSKSEADQSYIGNEARGPMRINLYPTEGEIWGFAHPSVIIAFDSTYSSKPELLKKLRNNGSSGPTPLLSLIVTHSIEHLDKCFEPSPAIERKVQLVNCLTQIGQDENVGKLDSSYHNPPDAAASAARWVANGCLGITWPLSPMPAIEGLDLSIDSQPEEVEGLRSRSSVQPPPAPQLGLKRDLDTSHEMSGSPKRQKLSPIPGHEPSHISDTDLHTSSVSAEVSEMIAKAASLDEQQGDQVSMLLKKVNDLEVQLRSQEATQTELRQLNQGLEARCNDYESSIATIQPKYQEALNERGQFEYDYNLALARNHNLKRDYDAKDAEVSKLREQKTATLAELVAAQTALSSSSIPEIAELGKLREETAAERAEKQRLEKRLASMESELNYMRTSYQEASRAAGEAASENRGTQAELERLREKAKGDMVRIHEINHSGEVREHLRRITTLTEENRELERRLERKDEELRALMNGRRATRGTSVPRSPRMGAGTMSPNPRTRGGMQMGGIGMAMGGGGSRGNSPAPGELPGYRGAAFGEPLYPADGRSARWGTHLQQ